MNVYLLIAFIVVLVSTAVCGVIAFDRYLEKKRDERLNKIVCDDVIPAAKDALESYTEELLNSVKEMADDWMKNLKEL